MSTQLALVVVLLAGAGLLLRSYVALNRADLYRSARPGRGWRSSSPPRYAKGGTSRAFMREVESRVEATTGSQASVSMPPLGFTMEDDALPEVEGSAPPSQPDDSDALEHWSRVGRLLRGCRHSHRGRPDVHAG